MWPVIVGGLLVLPFMALEFVNTRGFNGSFPLALFVFMWLLGSAFLLAATNFVRRLQAAGGTPHNALRVLPALALSIAIAWLWVGLVADQMPCFLGVPNCD